MSTSLRSAPETQPEKRPVLDVTELCVGYESVRFSSERRGVFGLFGFRRRFSPVLSSLSFRIPFDRSVTAIVGANGAGKTTLLRAIAGVVPAYGKITWAGQRLDCLTAHERVRAGVTFVPHENGLFPNLTVREHLQLMERTGGSSDHILEKLRERLRNEDPLLISSLDFLLSNHKVGNLSGGEQKMLSLIRPLFGQWSLILIDELTAGLSPSWHPLLSVIIQMYEPACILQTEQYSRAPIARDLGANLYELKEGSLEIWHEG